LRLGEALIAVGARAPRHLIIDPFQESAFANAGWELLEAAALHPTTRLIREPSSVALPQLVAEAVTADAAFIDGSHRFHEVFVDLYFLRKIVRPGGLVVVDDHVGSGRPRPFEAIYRIAVKYWMRHRRVPKLYWSPLFATTFPPLSERSERFGGEARVQLSRAARAQAPYGTSHSC
jgi:predicted O-methyltransferase YrrM